MKIRIISIVALMTFVDSTRLSGEENIRVINSSRAVGRLEVKSLYSAWSVIRIDYPLVQAVFMCSSGNFDFCLFKLNDKEEYLVFASPTYFLKFKLEVDGEDITKSIKPCFLKVKTSTDRNSVASAEEETIDDRPFGLIFKVDKDKEIKFEFYAKPDEAEAQVILKRQQNLWTGRVDRSS